MLLLYNRLSMLLYNKDIYIHVFKMLTDCPCCNGTGRIAYSEPWIDPQTDERYLYYKADVEIVQWVERGIKDLVRLDVEPTQDLPHRRQVFHEASDTDPSEFFLALTKQDAQRSLLTYEVFNSHGYIPVATTQAEAVNMLFAARP